MSMTSDELRYGVMPDGRMIGPALARRPRQSFRELEADLWTVPAEGPTLRLITTNGATRKDGACVMGRGCACEARDKFPGLDQKLGRLIREHGNRPMRLMRMADGSDLGSFPVKVHWKEKADLDLIEASARLLVELVDKFGYSTIFLPRPGTGNGSLQWDHVHERLEPILDPRFVLLHR